MEQLTHLLSNPALAALTTFITLIQGVSMLLSIPALLNKLRKARLQTQPSSPPVPPGYYRRRMSLILIYILAIPMLALIVLAFWPPQDLLVAVVVYASIVAIPLVALAIPLTIYAMMRRL